MNPLSGRRYLKMNGLGNEIVVLDLRGTDIAIAAADAAAIAADPASRFDQMMALRDPRAAGTDAYVEIFNADGSQAEACGNGTRCVAWAMAEDRLMGRPGADRLLLHTRAGFIPTVREGDVSFTVDMGAPRLRWDQIPTRDPFADTRGIELQIGPIDAPILHTPAVVNMGNPHAVFFVGDVGNYDLAKIGPLLENHPIFPDRANISLAQMLSREHIRLRVWERGAGLTRACGSAACAALVCAVRKGLSGRKATVSLPGGDLGVEWRESDSHVLMTGPVEFEHEGALPPSLFSAVA